MSDKPILTLDDFMDAEKQKTELINVGCAEQFCTQPQDLHKKTNEE